MAAKICVLRMAKPRRVIGELYTATRMGRKEDRREGRKGKEAVKWLD